MSLPAARRFLVREIRRHRQADRTIPVVFAADREVMQNPRACRSNFFNGLFLSAIQSADPASRAALQDIAQGHAAVIRAEIGAEGTLNYWTRSEPLRVIRPYPDDLDTTSCALSALIQADASADPGAILGSVVRVLTALEVAEGGPYRSWAVPADADAAWKDIDIAVNANIAFLLSLHGIRLEPLDAWLRDRVQAHAYASPYYPSPHAIWYYLARGGPRDAHDALADDMLAARLPDGGWGNVIDTAFALAALRRVRPSSGVVAQAQRQFAARLAVLAAIPTGACCMDADEDGHVMYAGSPALTAALCLDALAGTDAFVANADAASAAVLDEDRMLEAVRTIVHARAAGLGVPLGDGLRRWSDRIRNGERGREIPLLPYRFHAELTTPVLSDEKIALLGAANVYGWIAYTIYDDLLDGEGSSADLPVANVCLRSLGAIFARVASEIPHAGKLYRDVMDGIERANAWEAAFTRIAPFTSIASVPNYGNRSVLAERSFGHALGPLTIALAAGHGNASPEFAELRAFFQHALIARQLDDDAHDWEADLNAGRINAVASLVLNAWRAQGRRLDEIQRDDLGELTHLFWSHVVEDVASLMLEHVRFAETCLSQLTSLSSHEALSALLTPSRRSAEKALQGMRDANAFLASYRRSPPNVVPEAGSAKNS